MSGRSVGDSSRTLRGSAAVKESTGRSSTQECSATQKETVFSQQRVAQKSIPSCREGSPGRSENNEKSIPNCREGSLGRSEKNEKSIA